MMRIIYIVSIISLLLIGSVNAQSNIQTMGASNIFSNEAAFLNPAFLKDNKRFQLNVIPLGTGHFHLSNNFTTAAGVLEMLDIGEYAASNPSDLMNRIKKNNFVNTQMDFTLLHLNFRIAKINFGISARQHISANLGINGDFLRLVYGGNKQFAGQRASFDPNLSMIAYTDLGFAVSRTINVGDLKITPGLRVRYLLGEGMVYTGKTTVGIYTEENGEYLDIDGKLSVYGAGPIDVEELVRGNANFNLDLDDLLENKLGHGFALDFGATVEYKNLSVSLASINNGNLTFKEGLHLSSPNINLRFEGIDAFNSDDELSYYKKILDEVDMETNTERISTNIGSKITFNANYGLIGKTDKRENNYFMHNFGVSYIQGVTNRFSANSSPLYSVYYQFNLANRISVGVNYNGQGGVHDMGMNFGFRLLAMNFGFGTNSLFALTNPQHGTQANGFIQFGLAF